MRHVARVAGALACSKSQLGRIGKVGQFDFFDYGQDLSDISAVPVATIPSGEIPSFDEFGYGLQDVQSIPTFDANIFGSMMDQGFITEPGVPTVEASWYESIPWDMIGKTAASLITAAAPVAAKVYAASQGAPTTASAPIGTRTALPAGYGINPTTGQITTVPAGATVDARGVIVPAASEMPSITSMLPWLALGGAALFFLARR